MSSIPTTRQALIFRPETGSVAVESVAMPELGRGEVLVRVYAVALNPVDALYVAHPLATTPRVVGTDFAGVVVGLGEGVDSSSRAQLGARVAGFLQGAASRNERPGAFAEYVAVPHDLVWAVPDDMALADAAAVSMCAMTAAQGIFSRQGLAAPFWPAAGEARDKTSPAAAVAAAADNADPLAYFIYGATTSLGMYAAQLVHASAKASGRKVRLVGAASPRHFDFLVPPTYNYSQLVDRDVGVDLAFDSISEGDTLRLVDSTLKPSAPDGALAIFRQAPEAASLARKAVYGAAWEALGVDVEYDHFTIRANPRARAFAAAFYDWLSTSPLVPNPTRRMPGGLERIAPDGFALLGTDRVSGREGCDRTEEYMRPISGEKLVYVLVDEEK